MQFLQYSGIFQDLSSITRAILAEHGEKLEVVSQLSLVLKEVSEVSHEIIGISMARVLEEIGFKWENTGLLCLFACLTFFQH